MVTLPLAEPVSAPIGQTPEYSGVLFGRAIEAQNPPPMAKEATFTAIRKAMAEAITPENLIAAWWELEGVGLMGEIVAGNVYADDIGNVQMRRLAEGVTRLIYSEEESLRELGAEVFHRIGDERMRTHMDFIDPFARSNVPKKQEPAWWRKAASALFQDTATVLEAPWQYVAAPIIGQINPMVRKTEHGLWVSRSEMDVDEDGRVEGYEALFGRNSETNLEKGIEIGFEIGLDPTTYLSFGVGASARGALKSVGRGLRNSGGMAGETAGESLERIAKTIGEQGPGALSKTDREQIAAFVLADQTRATASAIKKARGLRNIVIDDVDDPIAFTRAQLLKTDDVWAMPLRIAAWSVQSMGQDPVAIALATRLARKNLNSLGRVRQGPKLMGVPLPWHSRLTPSGAAPRFFTPQIENLMGGPASPMRKLMDKPFQSIRQRTEITAEYGRGVADDVVRLQRWSRGDLALKDLYSRTVPKRARAHMLQEFGRTSVALKALDGSHLTQMTFDDLTLDYAMREGLGLSKEQLRYKGVPQKEYAEMRRTLGLAPEQMREAGILTRKQAAERRALWEQQANKWRRSEVIRRARAYGNPGDVDRYIPIEEWRELMPRGSGPKWKEFSKDSQRKARYATTATIKSDLDNSLIMLATPEAMGAIGVTVNAGLGAMQFLNRLWASSALSLIRGPTYLVTNVLGGFSTGIQAGVNPIVASRIAPEAFRTNMIHLKSLRTMQRTKKVKEITREKFGTANLDKFWEKMGVTTDEGGRRWVAKAVRDGTLSEDEAQRFTDHLDVFGLGGNDATAYTTALDYNGATAKQIRTLYGAGAYGILQGGRARDTLYEGLELRGVNPNMSPAEMAAVEKRNKRTEVQKKVTDWMNLGLAEVSIFSEDMLRLGTFMAGEAQGLGWDDAAELVYRSQFDYNDLTRLEHSIKSNLSRFWTYPKKLMGLMAETMLTHPGRIAAVTRTMGDTARYIAGFSQEEDWIDFLVPSWVERQPGVWMIGGLAGRLRIGLYEYMELMGTIARIPNVALGQDIFSGDALPRVDAAQEAAQDIAGLTSGFAPETFKTMMEVATGYDSFTGASLEDEQAIDQVQRWLGIIVPGHMTGVKTGVGIADMWSEGEPHRRDALVRLMSTLSGIWFRGHYGLDAQRLRDLQLTMNQAVEDYEAEGSDVVTLTDLQDYGVIQPGQGARLRWAYGMQVEREDDEFDEDEPLDLQRRPITREELATMLPPETAEALGYATEVRREAFENSKDYWEAVMERQIVASIAREGGEEDYLGVIAKRVFGNRGVQAAAGVTPAPEPLETGPGFDIDHAISEAMRELAKYGVELAELQTVAPYLDDVSLRIARMQLSGMNEDEILLELWQEIPPELQRFLNPRLPGGVNVTGLPYQEEELLRWAERQGALSRVLEYVTPYDEETASFLATVGLLTAGERSALGLGLPESAVLTLRAQGFDLVRAVQRVEAAA